MSIRGLWPFAARRVLGRSGLALVLLGIVVALAPGLSPTARADANGVTVGKLFCPNWNTTPLTVASSGCSAGPPTTDPTIYTQVHYALVILNAGSANATVNLAENYPASFVYQSAACNVTAPTAGATVNPNAPASGTPLSVQVAAGQTVTCLVTGYFTSPGATAINTVTYGAAAGDTATVQTHVNNQPVLPNDLGITKTVSPSWPTVVDVSGAPQVVTYTIKLKNLAAGPVYLGRLLDIWDELALPGAGVPLDATYVPGSTVCNADLGSDCVSQTPAANLSGIVPTGNWKPFLRWNYAASSPGLLNPGSTMTLTYKVRIARRPEFNCVKAVGGDGLRNHAFFSLTRGSVTVTEQNPNNNYTDFVPNTASDVKVHTGALVTDPMCGVMNDPNAPPPVVTVLKEQIAPTPTSTPHVWNTQDAWYRITIKNTSATAALSNVRVRDFVSEDAGTPPFTVVRNGATCSYGTVFVAAPCATFGTLSPTPNPQSLVAYYSSVRVYDLTLATLAPGQTVQMVLQLRYRDPLCDSMDANAPNRVINTARVTYTQTVPMGNPSTPQPVNYQVDSQVATPMQPSAKCGFKVTKQVISPPQPGNRIVFGQPNAVTSPFRYRVTFTNTDTFSRQVGTVMDALRLREPNYAVSLPIRYRYDCSQTGGVSGYTAAFPAVVNAMANGAVSHTTYPSQGTRVINMSGGPVVTFPPGSTLTCVVQLVVIRPDPGDPYCFGDPAREPQIENLGLMDISRFYDPNLPWPPSNSYNPTALPPQPNPQVANWATVTTPLPRCFDVSIGKYTQPNPTSTTTLGGPVSYRIDVKNNGPHALPLGSGSSFATWSGLKFEDVFTPYYPYGAFSTPCVAAWCQNFTVSLSPGRFGIRQLAAGATQSLVYQVNPAPTFQKPEIRNCVVLSAGGVLAGTGWYAKNPNVLGSQLCTKTPVEDPTGTLNVEKLFAPGTIPPPGVIFPVSIACAPGGTTVVQLTAGNSYKAARTGIPLAAGCAIQELAPVGAVPPGCVWLPPIYGKGQKAKLPYALNSKATLTVTNTLVCKKKPPSTLTIRKLFDNPPPAGTNLPVTVTCNNGGPSASFAFTPTAMVHSVSNIPSGSTCTVTETPPPGAISMPGCFAPGGWNPPGYAPAQSVTLQNGMPALITVHNSYSCYDGKLGSVSIRKAFQGPAPGIPAPAAAFTVTLTCASSGANPNGPVQTVTLSAANPMATVGDIPVGNVCTAVETPITTPVASPACPTGYGHWQPPIYSPASAVVPPAPKPGQISILNVFRCDGTGVPADTGGQASPPSDAGAARRRPGALVSPPAGLRAGPAAARG